MISLRPFRAWRPAPDKAPHVGSRSYISYSPEQLAYELERDPYSFLHVIHPPEADEQMPRQQRYACIRRAFQRFIQDGVIVREQEPAIYVYEQQAHGNTSRGIIVGVSVQDHLEGRIKVHEQTLTAREQLFTEYLEATGINAEPVLLATPPGTHWQDRLLPILSGDPLYDHVTEDGVRHKLWVACDPDIRVGLQQEFAQVEALYIADGHHRMASSARLAEQQHAADVDPMAWCLAYIVPHDHLHIYNYDRVVHGLNGMSAEELLQRIGDAGSLSPIKRPRTAPGTIAIRTRKGWHALELPKASEALSPAERLDPVRLSSLILAPMLGITDLRNDRRVSFIPGTEGPEALERMVAQGEADIAFHLHPVSFQELRAVADSGGTMPPKSTYIEPKLRSGVTVYSLEDV